MASDIPIIDAHTHVHATREDAHAFLDLLNPELTQTGREGSIDASLALMGRLGIQSTLILPWVFGQRIYALELERQGRDPATEDDELKDRIATAWTAYNDWAIGASKEHPGRFAAMCAIDPILLGEQRTRMHIDHCIAIGAIGLKVVPGFMNAYPHDPRMSVVWEEASLRGLSVTAQCSGPKETSFAHPAHFEDVFRSFPKANIVLAHMGLGGGEEDVVRLANTYANVFADTSSWLGAVGKPGGRTPQEAVDLFRRIGIDRLMFGSNYPITDVEDFVAVLRSLPLTQDEQEKLFFQNAMRVHRGLGHTPS
jgi:uncharacterized protein